MKILLLGALTYKKDRTKTGGVVILFELLLKELKKHDIEFKVIDTLVDNYGGKLQALVKIWSQLFKEFYAHEHISVHATTNSLLFNAPLVIILSKLFGKTSSLRMFGGDLIDTHTHAGFLKKRVIEFVVKNVDINFFETKYMVKHFTQYNANTHWFPNVREKKILPEKKNKYKKRFIFLGTITEEKGIDLLIVANKRLSDEFSIDIYGPLIDEKYGEAYFHENNINYCGAIESHDVLQTLSKYDVLVLPSYREGYPGVIIEAFMVGIPVIATRLDGIIEMVEDKHNGILINVGETDALLKAIQMIDENMYVKLSQNAQKSFEQYDSKIITKKFIEKVNECLA